MTTVTNETDEIRKPGGFAMMFLNRISAAKPMNIEILEKAIRKLEENNVITYDIVDGKPIELFDDLLAFADVGWIKFHPPDAHIQLTSKGVLIIERLKLPSKAIAPFEKVVQDIISQP